MELRQLEAFVAVATELHFGRAAEQLRMGQPTLSDLIRRLERELGAPLLTRTTRKVALTGAGQGLLGRAKVILDEVAAAAAAVRRTAQGDTGTVRVAITPPVAPVLAPHLLAAASEHLPGVTVGVQRMWLPDLTRALAEGYPLLGPPRRVPCIEGRTHFRGTPTDGAHRRQPRRPTQIRV